MYNYVFHRLNTFIYVYMLQVKKMFYTFNPNLTYLVMKKILLFIGIISLSYNLNAQCDSNLPVMETFDTNTIGVCWQIFNKDGDVKKMSEIFKAEAEKMMNEISFSLVDYLMK